MDGERLILRGMWVSFNRFEKEAWLEIMDGKSLDIREQQLNRLKELFPEVVSDGKVDWEKLRLALGEDITIDNERYVLNWAGKSDAFRAIQTPTTATLKPKRDQSVDFDTTQNIFIEGENLEVLKVLQKSYYGKVKMIYIDPPYNTGNDSFIYPDKFSESKDEYLKRIGDKDEAGYLTKEGFFRKNSKENGQYHSNWLSMMYPRLFLARNLLRDDGVIFVSIDDNEVHNLRLMMNEIFGEENFIAELVWQSRKGGGSDKGTMVTDHEYVIGYIKSSKNDALSRIQIQAEELDRADKQGTYRRGRELNKWGSNSRREDRPTMWFPIPGPNGEDVYPIRNDGSEGCWRWGKKKMAKIVNEGNVDYESRKDGTFIVYEKIRSKDPRFKPYRTWLANVSTTADGSKQLKDIFEGQKLMDFPKPADLVEHLVSIGTTNDDDILLDFFAGSGTTAQAVMELNKEDGGNRKFILVQLPEKTDEDSEACKAGYKTIADICRERIRRAIKSLTPTPSPNGEGDSAVNGVENLFKGAAPMLFEYAHRMRLVDKTEAEERLWQALRNRKVENCKFRRQHPIGNVILDFYCHERKLAVEIDGGYHNEQEQKEHDAARTQVVNEFGIRVIRFSNEEVLKDTETTVNKISEALKGGPADAPLSERRGAGGEAGFKAFSLEPSNFKVWRTDTIENGDDLNKQMDAFADPLKAGSEADAMAWEILVKSGYELTTKLEKLTVARVPIHSIAEGEVVLALEKISREAIAEVVKRKPKNFICLDRLFAGNDQLKTNTALQMKDAGVEFKTI